MWVLRNFFQKLKILGDFSEKSFFRVHFWGLFLVPPKIPHLGCFWPLLPTRLNFYGSNQKMDPKKRFFWKIPQDFELLKKVPQNSHQTGHFGWNRYIGTLNLSEGAFLSVVSPDKVSLLSLNQKPLQLNTLAAWVLVAGTQRCLLASPQNLENCSLHGPPPMLGILALIQSWLFSVPANYYKLNFEFVNQ